MSRGYRFGVAATIWLFAISVHYIGTAMFGPSGALWGLAQPAIDAGFIQSGYREQQYRIFAQYMPLLLVVFGIAWLFFSEYEAQSITRRRRR